MGVPNTLRGGKQRSTAISIPAPIGGIDALKSLAQMKPDTCIYTYNILAEDFGMKVRDGYVEWANGWTGGAARTVMPFEGNVDADDRLFVANNEGIWDVTVKGTTTPANVLTWPDQTLNAGICSFINYTNDSGTDRFLLVCDEQNGYYIYTQTTNSWAQGTITGGVPDAEDLVYLTIWKQRVWFAERDSPRAWYLPPGDLIGNPVEFNFGSQFRFGGQLRSIHNWTLDGGNGMDDYLVALSSSGDVIVYQGTDPADASSFGLVGSWYIGQLPAGRRIATEFSGELYILSVYGLVGMSQILNGQNVNDPMTYLTKQVSPYIRRVLDTTLNDFGWHIHIHPKQSLLFVNSPPRVGFEQLAFTAYFGNLSWSMVRGLNKAHTYNWRGEVYWTDIKENRLYIQQGAVDNVLLDPDTDGQPKAIEWDLLTAYLAFDSPVLYKRVQYIRPMFVANGVPGFTVQARYDYDLAENTGSPLLTDESAALWDSGLWDIAKWGGGLQASDNPRGARGLGRHVAISIRGKSSENTTLVSFDITYDSGGMM